MCASVCVCLLAERLRARCVHVCVCQDLLLLSGSSEDPGASSPAPSSVSSSIGTPSPKPTVIGTWVDRLAGAPGSTYADWGKVAGGE